MMRKLLTVTVLAFLFSANLAAQNPNLGTAGAQFLKIPVGARAAGMGGAIIGMTNDASSVFWNPAGIANVRSNSIHFSHMNWFEFFNLNAVSYVVNAGNIGAFGIGAVTFGMDEMEMTTEMEPNGTGRTFDAQDLALSLSYSRNLTDKFRVGLSGKYIHQRIWNETSAGVAFDVGTQYQIDFKNLVLSMSMMNFGPDLKMEGPDLNITFDENSNYPNRLVPAKLETESYPLPLLFKFGIAMDVINTPFIKIQADVDAIHPNDNDEQIYTGAEFGFMQRFFLRGGYKFNHDDEQYSFGLGVNSRFAGNLVQVDYAYAGYNLLPDVHFITMNLTF